MAWSGTHSVCSPCHVSEGSPVSVGGCVMGRCGQNRGKRRGNGNYSVLSCDKDLLFDLRNKVTYY